METDRMESAGLKLKLYLSLLIAIIGLSTVVFSTVENLSVLDAFYFSVVTIATVGYGDIHPTTSLGKLLCITLIIAGVGTFLEVIAGITQVMIGRREKEVRMEKRNMIVGLFFSEIGTKLMKIFALADSQRNLLYEKFSMARDLEEKSISHRPCISNDLRFDVDLNQLDLEWLRQFVSSKGDLLLRLLENPTLLEHESFTELLRAIFHVRDEFMNRDLLAELPDSDKRHLSRDMERAYKLLASHWLIHIRFLKRHYPYLFSLAVRTNPRQSHSLKNLLNC